MAANSPPSLPRSLARHPPYATPPNNAPTQPSNPTPLHSTPPNIILGQSGQPKIILGALSVISVPWQETACRLFLLLFLLRIFEETTLNRTEHAPRGFPAYFSTVPPSFPQFCLIINNNNNNSRTPVSVLTWSHRRACWMWTRAPAPPITPRLTARLQLQSRRTPFLMVARSSQT